MKSKNQKPRITVRDFFNRGAERLNLEFIAGEAGLDRAIRESAINRPGLTFAGFYDFFPSKRIQLIGHGENLYLKSLPEDERRERLERFFAMRAPCVVYTRNRRPPSDVVALAEKYSVPLFRTQMITGLFANAATIIMEDLSAPRIRVHGTMMEVAGIGVFIEGEPGIGKSETALGLIKHGHALVADDCTEFKPDSRGLLIGSAVEVTRYYMEIRGLGIIHVPSIFGVSSVRDAKQLNLVVTLMRQSENESELDRVGENNLKRTILGISVPQVIIPVAPGRELVNVVETVAQEYKLRMSGQVAYRNLDERIKRNNTVGL